MSSKKQILKVYFKINCSDMYEAEFGAYKKAVKEWGTTYFPSFEYWMDCHANSYNVLKDAIEFAGYHYPQSDRTWSTAIDAFSDVGCDVMQHD